MFYKNNLTQEEVIKQRLVKEYVKEFDRAPLREELSHLYQEFLRNNPGILSTGYTANSNDSFYVKESSSSSKYNEKLDDFNYDLKTISNLSVSLDSVLEASYRSLESSVFGRLQKIKKIEREVNRLLLLSDSRDSFFYGVSESFDDMAFVDLKNSTTSFSNGKVALGIKNYEVQSIVNEQLSYGFKNDSASILSINEISSIRNVLKQDGSLFQTVAYSERSDDVVALEISLKFQEPKKVQQIRLVLDSIERNSDSGVNILYTKDLTSYSLVKPANLRLSNGENFFDVNQDEVKELKISLIKSQSDFKEGNRFGYVYSIDFLGFVGADYIVNKESFLYSGPYEIKDEKDSPVFFSMATIKTGTCCIVPEKSSVNFFLSKDNANWVPCSYHDRGPQIAIFDAVSFTDVYSKIDLTKTLLLRSEELKLTVNDIDVNLPLDLDGFNKEAYLSIYIPAANLDKVKRNTIVIKRNTKSSAADIYDADSGWFKEGNLFVTTINILALEGQYIDLGFTSCLLNDKVVTGKVFIPQGCHIFKTDQNNWINITENLTSVDDLIQQDILYPYNHKLLIEGYNYQRGFSGERFYQGVDEYFGSKLKYVTPERFSTEESVDQLDLYTIIENEYGLFFKIKLLTNSDQHHKENIDVSFKASSGEISGNKLYIKAILNTIDERISPKIDIIQVRVL